MTHFTHWFQLHTHLILWRQPLCTWFVPWITSIQWMFSLNWSSMCRRFMGFVLRCVYFMRREWIYGRKNWQTVFWRFHNSSECVVCLFVCLNYKGDTEVVEMTCVEYTVEGIAMRTESNERRKQSIVFRCSMNTVFSYQIDISPSTLSLIIIE